MNRKSVTLLNIQSNEVTALIGERGVNNTFVFKGIKTEKYDGFADGRFFDIKNLASAVKSAIFGLREYCQCDFKEVYVGVADEFITLVTKKHFIGFSSAKKITAVDVDSLYNGGLPEKADNFTLIKQSSMYYCLSDKRRTINPVGFLSSSLEGYLCYFLCDNYFIENLNKILYDLGVKSVKFLPNSLSQTNYLIPNETRDEYAILLDIGYISSTFCVALGNGLVFQKSFSLGGGHISAYVCEKLDLPFDIAETLIRRVNLSGKINLEAMVEYTYDGKENYVKVKKINDAVKEGLDIICETVNNCLQLAENKNLEYKPVYLTGDGVTFIRGAREHISGRLNKVVEVLSPNLPYYNKPSQSSILSLLEMALEDKKQNSFINKFFK